MENKKIEMDEILSNYKTISIEKMLGFLNEENEKLLLKHLQNKTINLDDVELSCHKSYPNNPKLAEIFNDLLSKKLAQNKELTLTGKNAEKLKLIVKMEEYKDKVAKGNLSQTELKELCDIAFGKDSDESKIIYEKMFHLVKTDEQRKYEEKQDKIKKEMLQEIPNEHQIQTEENKIAL